MQGDTDVGALMHTKQPNDTLDPQDLQDFLSVRLTNLSRKFALSSAATYEREYDVSPRELRILMLLHESAPLTSSQMADMADMDKATISRGVSSLRKRRLVEAFVSQDDLRSSTLALTLHGRDIASACFKASQNRMRRVIEVLSKDERRMLSRLLIKVDAQLDAMNTALVDTDPYEALEPNVSTVQSKE